MMMLRHKNVCYLHTTFLVGTKLWMVMPCSDRGSVYDAIRQVTRKARKGHALAESTVAAVMVQALQGLAYLHENKVIHRDIKAANILLNSDGVCSIADVGLAVLHRFTHRYGCSTFVGTPCWMAPEIIESQMKGTEFEKSGYGELSDVWSLGITGASVCVSHCHCHVTACSAVYCTVLYCTVLYCTVL